MIASHSHLHSTLDRLDPILQSTAKNLLRHLQDDPIAQAQGTFADLDELYRHILHDLNVRILQLALQQEADRRAGLPAPNCPNCSQPTVRQEPRLRRLQTDAGEVQWNEPECTCERCRKAFFPSERSDET